MEILDGAPASRENTHEEVLDGDSLPEGQWCTLEGGNTAVEELQAADAAGQLAEIVEVLPFTSAADAFSAGFSSATYLTGAVSMQATAHDVMVLSKHRIQLSDIFLGQKCL